LVNTQFIFDIQFCNLTKTKVMIENYKTTRELVNVFLEKLAERKRTNSRINTTPPYLKESKL
jgi:hypothetical protein